MTYVYIIIDYISTISGNVLNANQNSLSTLSIDYISYFYYYYSHLLETFPNLFSKSFIIQIDNLMKYINCSLTRFKSNVTYLSIISSTLTSHSSNIKSLTDLIPQFKGLINNVFCNLRSAITLNITLVCLKIYNIDKSIKCCRSNLGEAVKIVCCIIKLICKCKSSIISCFQGCLNQIKSQLIQLETMFPNLYDSYGYINYLRIQTQKIIKCNKDISSLKDKISELIKSFKCSLSEFKCIESWINCIKTKIDEISKLKQELFKYIEPNGGTTKLTIKCNKILVAYISKNGNGNNRYLKCLIEKIKSLGQSIEKICSQFTTIEDNTTDLKHSLLFNSYYLEISSHILDQLCCIESQKKTLIEELSKVDAVSSHISVISDNVNYVKSMIEGINEGANDLAYFRDTMKYIMPKLCQIKESAKMITTKSTELECIVESLKKIQCSIQNLQVIEYDQKCLEIFDLSESDRIHYSLKCIRDKLDIKSITNKLDTVQKGISSLESVISNTNNLLAYIKNIEYCIKYIVQWIDEVENSLDNIIKRFIRCSLQSISNHLIISNRSSGNISNIRDAEVDNRVVSMYSLMNVMDYWVVVNRLYESAKKIDQILNLHINIFRCKCILELEWRTKTIELNQINVQKIIEEMKKEKDKNQNDSLKLDKIRTLIQNDIKDNHLCLCMVFKYILYPQIINLTYVMSVDLRALSTISRKFNKYGLTRGWKVNLSQFFIVCVELLYKVSMYILLKNKYTWVSGHPFHVKCFCMYSDDPSYSSVVSIILVLSSVIENIWIMDTESLRMTINCLSSLISEFDIIDSQNNKSTDNNNKKFYDIISSLFCPLKFCRLGPKVPFILDFVSFCLSVPFLSSFIKRYICNFSLFDLFNFENIIKELKHYNSSNSSPSLSDWVIQKYQSHSRSNNLCNQFKNQCCVVSSNIVIIVSMLISVKMSIKLYSKKCQQLKEQMCCFLKSICNCNSSDCCLKNILESKDQICNGNNNNCDQLINKCVELCCDNKCCNDECPCKEIKSCCDKLNELCCKSGQNGLCKIIESIQKCRCNSKHPSNGGCICVCCKIVIKSILILQNMFDNIVLIISKNVIVSCKYILEIMDKIKKTNNSQLIIKSIVDNNSRYNKAGISLVKHNCITSNSNVYTKNIGVTNVETRNWGYDTKYEHDVSTDKGFTRGYECLNLLSDPRYTFSHLSIFLHNYPYLCNMNM